ncbi:MAG: PIN domain-containing protein [Caulobacteraceae bacterium]
MPRIALDTNILVYSEGLERSAADGLKVEFSRRLIRALRGEGWVAPVQVLAELHSVLVRRGRLGTAEAARRVERLAAFCELAPTLPSTLSGALGLADVHKLQIYDAIILAAAAEARCDLLLSEGLHDGFTWLGVAVANPFGAAPDPRLRRLMEVR